MNVYVEMQEAAQGAPLHKLGEVTSAIYRAYGAGGLTDEQVEQLDALLQARQSVGGAAPSPAERLVVRASLPPLPARAQGKARAGTKPRTRESLARRRGWAAAGYLPPKLAAAFTLAEQAALAVVARELGKRGSCTLSIGAIAAEAGVGETSVKNTLRLARTMGLITVEERRVSCTRNDTNVVRLASKDWTAWLRLRLPRSALAAPGGKTAPSTYIGRNKGWGKGLETPPSKPASPADRAGQVLLFLEVAR